jgi:hypothetical protein
MATNSAQTGWVNTMKLSRDEVMRYLASVAHVTRLDGKLCSKETEHMNEILKRIGAGKSELSQACSLAEDGAFRLAPLSRFSLNVQLLEDLIVACLIDGTVDVAEQKPVVEFAISAGISQEQLSMIAKDANAIIASFSESKPRANDG